MELKKIALEAARKRVSPQTGFLHYWIDDPYHPSQDTIPFIENVLYVYALFRSKLLENIQEGKELLGKLLAFEVDGNFPVYLHEFPVCRNQELPSHFLPPFFYLLKDFSSALGEIYREKLRTLCAKMVQHLESVETLSTAARCKLLAFQGKFSEKDWTPKSIREWGEFCLCCQMTGKEPPSFQEVWDPNLEVFIGESKERYQDSLEPATSLLDLFMGELFLKHSKRALQNESLLLKACLVHPWSEARLFEQAKKAIYLVEETKRQALTIYWKGKDRLHSLVLESKRGSWKIDKTEDGFDCVYTYDPEVPGEVDSFEWAFYINNLKEHQIKINGEKATLFHPNEEISISSEGVEIKFEVLVDPSEGLWTGHLARGDRLHQIGRDLPYGGYDWKLGFRTVQRQSKAQVAVKIKLQEATTKPLVEV